MAIDIVARALAVSGKQSLENYYTKTESDAKYSQATNLKNGTGVNSVQQTQDSSYICIAIKTKNPNAYALDNTLTDSEPIGGIGDYASSFGGASSAQGKRSHAEGTNTIAKGKYSHAEGDNSVALGNDSHAEGTTTVSQGIGSHAEGSSTQSNGRASHAEGTQTKAVGEEAHAEGLRSVASGNYSHAEGKDGEAAGDSSHVEGKDNTVHNKLPTSGSSGSTGGSTENPDDTNWNINDHYGEGAHAEGGVTDAYGYVSHTEGFKTVAYGHMSHAEGEKTQAGTIINNIPYGRGSHAEGYNTEAYSDYSHAEGKNTKASGIASHAEGFYTIASGDYSHAECTSKSRGTSSHAEGAETQSLGNSSHSECTYTQATGESSHAEGSNTTASGKSSHAGGYGSSAEGENSFAHGLNNRVTSENATAFGENTIANTKNLFVAGQFNKYPTDDGTLFQMGNGTDSDHRSNAFEIRKDGRAKVQSAPVDDNDVVRKVDLASLGGGKLYRHDITCYVSSTSEYIYIVVYNTSEVKIDSINDFSNSIARYYDGSTYGINGIVLCLSAYPGAFNIVGFCVDSGTLTSIDKVLSFDSISDNVTEL